MEDLAGKVAVVTGAASGIGRALARRFADEGMRVVLADVEQDALEAATTSLTEAGGEAIGVRTDVSDAAQVERLADHAVEAFGAIHVLCNNAGVHRAGTAWQQSADDWEWVLGVNLRGVVHGLRTCIPRMLAQGDACHIVNTASAGGLAPTRGGGAYGASKFAIVAVTEGIAEALADTPVGVSLLCPGGVATGIFRAERNRPDRLADVGVVDPEIARMFRELAAPDRTDQAPPEEIAGYVVDAVRADRFYVLPMQAGLKDVILDRMARIAEALRTSPTTGR
jgi:NAD(P)-dependent dehydrogenase (short-subunit alcohol dehydrogenase family)